MKGEYLEPRNTTSSPNMFSKLQQQQHQQQHHPHPHPLQLHHHHQQQQQLPITHHFQLSRDSQTSEEDNTSHNSAATTATPSTATPKVETKIAGASGDGASIEVVRRPRGRPPGSKNKPKPPVFITREPEPVMNPYILEVPGGSDVVEAISSFCRRKSIGICVLTGSGTVANVTLRQPSPTPTPGATITFHGRFDILSISATFLPQNATFQPVPNIFVISLAGPQGQIVGGSIVGPLVAAGTVYVIAASFNDPSYHRLPISDEPRNTVSGGGGAGGNEPQSPVASSGGGGGDSGHVGGGESCGISMYNCHLAGGGGGGSGNDVIWAPTARPPPQQQQTPPY